MNADAPTPDGLNVNVNGCARCGGTGFTMAMEPCDHGVAHAFATEWSPADPPTAWNPATDPEWAHGTPAIPDPPAPTGKKMASEKAMAFLARLCAERGYPEPEPMGAKAASALIDKLLKQPKTVELPRSNRFPGPCINCGVTVDAEKGHAIKVDGRWKVRHPVCPDPTEAAEALADQVTTPGIYHHGESFYRVKAGRHDKTAFWAERIIVTKPDDPHAGHFAKPIVFVRCGRATFLRASEKITLAEARSFGVAVGACINCGAHLDGEDGKSLTAGYGETCARNNGWRYPTTAEMKLIEAGATTWDELLAG